MSDSLNLAASRPSDSNPPSLVPSRSPHPSADALLQLLQLASPSLPVGAYSYSEGLETLVHAGDIVTVDHLAAWLRQELRYGTIRLETVAMVRTYNSGQRQDWGSVVDWNHWLSAIRDSEEMREQSWQMGRTLVQLIRNLAPELSPALDTIGLPCNYAIAFSLIAAHWHIDREAALLGYLHSWITNLVNAGIKLIPLGQTTGQRLLLQLYPDIKATALACQTMPDAELKSCNWGMTLACMTHETLYSRLFRS